MNEQTNQLITYFQIADQPIFGLPTEILTKVLMLTKSLKNTIIITHTTMLPEVFIQIYIGKR